MKTIPQRELRQKSGKILRKAERGQQFVISIDGRPVALLGPCEKQPWVTKAHYARLFAIGDDDPTLFDDIAEMGGVADLDERWAR